MLEAEEQAINQQEEFQSVSFHRIEELEQYGIQRSDIAKLKSAGFHTIESVSKKFPEKIKIELFEESFSDSTNYVIL